MDNGPLLCTHCEKWPATHWLEIETDDDPCCPSCFESLYRECDRCHHVIRTTQLVDVCVSRQTRLDPAEYASWCENCAAVDDSGPDGDRDDD